MTEHTQGRSTRAHNVVRVNIPANASWFRALNDIEKVLAIYDEFETQQDIAAIDGFDIEDDAVVFYLHDDVVAEAVELVIAAEFESWCQGQE